MNTGLVAGEVSRRNHPQVQGQERALAVRGGEREQLGPGRRRGDVRHWLTEGALLVGAAVGAERPVLPWPAACLNLP